MRTIETRNLWEGINMACAGHDPSAFRQCEAKMIS
jgi:hypothetical protein